MRISDWSSDVCSSDLAANGILQPGGDGARVPAADRIGDEGDDTRAIGRHGADDGAPGELVDRRLELRILLQRRAHRTDRPAELSGHRGVRIARRLAPTETGRAPGRERGCQYVLNWR